MVISFDSAKSRQKLKGRDADINGYKTAGDLHRKLEELPDDSKINFEVASGDADKVYESENFVVLMPRSLDASCALGRGTTWCTAITKGENLFYSYVLAGNIILYYVFDKNNKKRKWSIGTIQGKVQGPGYGGITVNMNNGTFNFKKVFKVEEKSILTAIESHSRKIGEHPALADVKRAVSSVPRFKKLTNGLRPPAYFALLNAIGHRHALHLSNDVQEYINEYSSVQAIKMSKSADPSDRRAAAIKQNKHTEVLERLAKDEDREVRFAVALNRYTSPETLGNLMNDTDAEIRGMVARSKKISPKILMNLAKDEDWRVRGAISNNDNTPPGALKLLVDDESEVVRSYLPSNPNTPKETLKLLMNDESTKVRQSVAGSPSIAPHILDLLVNDKSKEVRIALASNNSISLKTLKVLMKDRAAAVRSEIAKSKSLEPGYFAALAKDRSVNVRISVAFNRHTPKEIVAALANDKHAMIRGWAKYNLEKNFMVTSENLL